MTKMNDGGRGSKAPILAKAAAEQPKMRQPAETNVKDGERNKGFIASTAAAKGADRGKNPIGAAAAELNRQHPKSGQGAEMQHVRHVALHGMSPNEKKMK